MGDVRPTGWGHQCRRPCLWLARLRGRRLGAVWQCNCGNRWHIGVATISRVLPEAPLIYEWQEKNDV